MHLCDAELNTNIIIYGFGISYKTLKPYQPMANLAFQNIPPMGVYKMSYREEREFNANIGDKSIGTAGPDAIERDLDNLYANKTWNDKVLTLDNNIPYIPTLLYHPATKEYTDNSND